MRNPSTLKFSSIYVAAALDVVLILVFAAIGRDAHQHGDSVLGILATAWPFLSGALLTWLVFRVWRRPSILWPSGVAVWLGTVAGGMALRTVTGQTVVLTFVIVALISLAILLLGHRAITLLVRRLVSRRTASR